MRHTLMTILTVLLFAGERLAAATPEITGIVVSGPATITYQNHGSSLDAQIGYLAPTCYSGDPSGSPEPPGTSELTLHILRNDGGYVVFKYRFQSWDHTGYPQNDEFRALIYPWSSGDGFPYSGWRRVSVPDDQRLPQCDDVRDLGWIDAALYLPAFGEDPGYPNEARIRLQLLANGDGQTTSIEIRDLKIICAAGTVITQQPLDTPKVSRGTAMPGVLSVPRGDDLHSPELERPALVTRSSRKESATKLEQVSMQSTCNGCCVSPLTPLPPVATDPDSNAMEAGYNPYQWYSQMIPDLQTAEQCFSSTIIDASYQYTLLNTYRTMWYQQHLYEVWDKYHDATVMTDAACATVKADVLQHWNQHRLGFKPASPTNPRHPAGEAFDVSWKSIPDQVFVDSADWCGLHRRIPRDKAHLELK